MNKSIFRKTLLVGLAAVALSLLIFVGQSVLPPRSSPVAAAWQQEATLTPEPTPTSTPAETPTNTPTPVPPTPTPTPKPILAILKEVATILVQDVDANGIIDPGDTIKYTITYQNTGDVAVTGVTIVDDYDQGLIESITNISGEGQNDGNVITWEFGTVEAQKDGSLTYEATLKDKETFPPGSTRLQNTAAIDSDETESVSVTKAILVNRPNFTLLKGKALLIDQDQDESIGPGDTIKYTITYKNTGNVEATEVKVVDNYDQDVLRITNVSDPGQDNGDAITWVLGMVAAGASNSVTYEAVVKSSIPPGSTRIANTASIASHETAPVTAELSIDLVVPTPTPEPSPTPAPAPEGPTTGIFTGSPWVPALFILLFGLGAIGGLFAACFRIPVAEGEGHERLLLILEAITVYLIICAVIMLALGGGIKSEAAASIISAVAGYVFGRARAVIPGAPRPTQPTPAKPTSTQPPQQKAAGQDTTDAAKDRETTGDSG